jgi:putative glutamine amidotransferase
LDWGQRYLLHGHLAAFIAWAIYELIESPAILSWPAKKHLLSNLTCLGSGTLIMARPVIGITTNGRDKENRFTLPAEYIDAVRRAGASTVLLAPGESGLDSWLEMIDGLILTGGGDIEPTVYGGRHHETVYMVDPERDRSELELTRRVVALNLPILGICRGAQVINVALGGTLWEHLPDWVGDKVPHRAPERKSIPHSIRVEADSGLAKILGTFEFSSASWHHQAIREPAPGLEVVARAPDGVVEAVEKPDHSWLYAVQWHPELTVAEDPVQQRLFSALVEAAGRLL